MDNFSLLEERIKKAIEVIDRLNAENRSLLEENSRMKEELSKIHAKLVSLETKDREISDTVKLKLNNILNRLTVLEQI